MSLPAIVRSLAGRAERLVDRALCIVGAVAASQLPEFMQQYLQRLEGHLDEARLQVERFRQAAAQAGMTLGQLIDGAGRNPDPSMARMGEAVAELVSRQDRLASADAALRGASALTRPFVFLTHVDGAIARATWGIFRPAVPTTAEGFCYAAAGMVAALALYHLAVRGPIVRLARRRAASS